MTQATEVLFPTSADEAVAQFGDGSGVTVVGGGTIVMPEITYGRLAPTKALVLSRAGLDTLDVSGATVTLGAGLPVERLAALAQDVKALAAVRAQRRRLRDPRARRRSAATSAPARDRMRRAATSRAPLLALDARGALGRRRRRVDGAARGLPRPPRRPAPARRLLRGAGRRRRSPRSTTRTPTTTRCSPCPASRADGSETRSRRPGWPGPERAFARRRRPPPIPRRPGPPPLADVSLADDALASAWYRERTLPVLVRRVLGRARGVRMNLTVNGVDARGRERAAHDRCSTCCARSSASRARRPAASRAAAAPAPCSSTASRGAPA